VDDYAGTTSKHWGQKEEGKLSTSAHSFSSTSAPSRQQFSKLYKQLIFKNKIALPTTTALPNSKSSFLY
jgi:hypothetical protein